MTDQDPDAIWRPGYSGTVVYLRPVRRPPDIEGPTPTDVSVIGAVPVADSAPPPSPPAPRRRWIGVASIVIAVVAGAAIVASLFGGDDGAPPSSLERIPAASRQQWSVTLDASAVSLLVGSSDVIVAVTEGDRREVVAVDVGSGSERWRAGLPGRRIDGLEVLGGVAITVAVGADGDQMVRGLDASSGRERWSFDVTGADRATIVDGQLVVIRAGAGSSQLAFELLDPATGDLRSSIVGDDVSWNRFGLQRRDGHRIELFDRASFDPRGEIDLAALRLPPTSDVQAAAVEAGVVLATSNAVTLVGHDGLIRSTIELSGPGAATIPVSVETLDEAGRFVAVQRGDQLIVLSSEGGALRELWSDTAWIMDWHVDADRQLVATATVNGSVVAMPPQVVDATTGRTLWDGPSSVQRSSPFRMFAGDGFIAVDEPSTPGDPSEVVGYDLERTERWRQPIGPDTATILVDEGLVTIDRETVTGTTTLTLFS